MLERLKIAVAIVALEIGLRWSGPTILAGAPRIF